MLGVPLQVKGKTIGVLEVLNPSDNAVFTEEDIHSITILSAQAAVAIENARLFEQSDHIAEIIHELRTPITAVVGFSKLLIARDDIGRESRISFLETINQEAERLNEMLGKFLNLARLETRRIRFHMVRTNISELVKDASELLLPQAESRNIDLTCTVPSTEVELVVDPDLLKQVIINLLSNAVKYNRENGKIDITLIKQKATVDITVEDTGWGIPNDIIDHIFDRFYRVTEHQDKADGNGLGLSIVKEIVEAHDGTIRVKSELDKGTTFIVSLPTAT
jgi:signal transduction histidine kinase